MKKISVLFILIFWFAGCGTPSNPPENDGGQDKTPPEIIFNNLNAGMTLNKSYTIKVAAADNVEVEKVEFYIDDVFKSSDSYSPYEYIWNTLGNEGTRNVKAVAYDFSGNQSEVSLDVTVNNGFFIQKPYESPTLDGNNVLVKVSVPDAGTYTKVVFSLDGVEKAQLGTVSSESLDGITHYFYQWRWDSSAMPDGIHQLQVAGHRTDSTIDIDTMQVNIQNETGNITEAQDSSFGSNPGNLRMFKYIPDSVSSFSGPRPLVVALHGCAQTAASFAADTAWNAKAEEKGFYVVYPQQKAENHSDVCFSWFSSAHQKRGYREPLSIYQMVQYMKEHYNIDDSKVYITGFSAGGCMTSVMLATYPDVFSGGGIAAGIAYKMAEDVASAGWAMDGAIDKSASDLASFVTGAYPQFSGTYPKVILFQGTNDQIVDKKNLTELMEQWTAVHSISSTPGNPCDSEETLYGTRVKTYCINGMQHKVPRDVAAETSYVYPYAAVDATLKMIEFFGL